VFDFFYYRNQSPFEELVSNGYCLYTIPQIRDEILSGNTPQQIKDIYRELENSKIIKIYYFFGFSDYENTQENQNLHRAGFSTYQSSEEILGGFLTYKHFIKDANDEDYLLKPSSETKKINDRLLAGISTSFPTLTCDKRDALGKAKKDGHQVVYLGEVKPGTKVGFDAYDGSISQYITHCLSEIKRAGT